MKIQNFSYLRVEDILDGADEFRALLFKEGVLAFRGLNLTVQDFADITQALHISEKPLEDWSRGKATTEAFLTADRRFGEPMYDLEELDRGDLTETTPVEGAGIDEYTLSGSFIRRNENFATRFEQMAKGVGTGGKPPSEEDVLYPGQKEASRQTMIFWNMDDAYKQHLVRTNAIHMHTFTASEGAGGLGFVDMSEAFKALPSSWVDPLKKARKKETQVSYMPDGVTQYPHPVIKSHWYASYPVLHSTGTNISNPQLPFEFEEEYIEPMEFFKWVFDYVVNPDNQQWWDWEQGDLVIYDAYRLQTAWGAGFDLDELVFDHIKYHGGNQYAVQTLPPRDQQYIVPEGHSYHG